MLRALHAASGRDTVGSVSSTSKTRATGHPISMTAFANAHGAQTALLLRSDPVTRILAIVALVCIVFLLHVRSALVAIIMLPIGVLMAFIGLVVYMVAVLDRPQLAGIGFDLVGGETPIRDALERGGVWSQYLDATRSGTRALADAPRNIPDDVLKRLKDNGGVAMVIHMGLPPGPAAGAGRRGRR